MARTINIAFKWCIKEEKNHQAIPALLKKIVPADRFEWNESQILYAIMIFTLWSNQCSIPFEI